jgi:hypothetical protein
MVQDIAGAGQTPHPSRLRVPDAASGERVSWRVSAAQESRPEHGRDVPPQRRAGPGGGDENERGGERRKREAARCETAGHVVIPEIGRPPKEESRDGGDVLRAGSARIRAVLLRPAATKRLAARNLAMRWRAGVSEHSHNRILIIGSFDFDNGFCLGRQAAKSEISPLRRKNGRRARPLAEGRRRR